MNAGQPEHHPSPAPSEPSVAGLPRTRSRLSILTVAAALLALILASVALLVSWRALDQANDARDIAKAAGGGPVPPPSASPEGPNPPPTDSTSAPQTPDSTASEPELNAQTRYTVKYEKEVLTLRSGCNSSVDIDLDEPRVGVANGEDIEFSSICGADPSNFRLAWGSRGTQADTAALTPNDCADRIRKAPLGSDVAVPARKGAVMCVITSLTEAVKRGEQRKMVLVEVTGTSDDGTVTVSATAWNIPR